MKPTLTLYTRAGCHLCDESKKVISAAREFAAFEYQEFDIDLDPELRRQYNEEVPVIAIDGVACFRYKVTMNELLKKLAAGPSQIGVQE